ncbi:MAG: hypothetical protein MMC33_009968, partial [Icmadophila ericetorum]|nr:hypothetical protein [Icmadophila ericetorum]
MSTNLKSTTVVKYWDNEILHMGNITSANNKQDKTRQDKTPGHPSLQPAKIVTSELGPKAAESAGQSHYWSFQEHSAGSPDQGSWIDAGEGPPRQQ